jgi:2-oxo-3-hexenedioate decarboxylase
MDEHVIGIRLGPVPGPGSAPGPAPGSLTAAMTLAVGVPVPRDGLPDPRVVPEIVFLMASRLAGPGVTAATALSAVGSVHGGLSVVGNGCFVTGPVAVPPGALDLSLEACLLEVNGQVVDSATGAAVHGHPAQALARAAHDVAIEPGWLVLTGAMMPPVSLTGGVAAHFTHLGSVFLT